MSFLGALEEGERRVGRGEDVVFVFRRFFLDRVGVQRRRESSAERLDRRAAANARLGEEGAARAFLAGGAVEEEAVAAQRVEAGGELGHVDREVLVVVALPGDAGVERDRPQPEQAEAETGRFTRARHQVVDGQVAGIDESEPAAPTTWLVPTSVSSGQPASGQGFLAFPVHFEFALRRSLGVDAEARSGRSTKKVFGATDGGAASAVCLMMIWVKAARGMAGRLLEEEFGVFEEQYSRPVRFCLRYRSRPESPRPAFRHAPGSWLSMMSTAPALETNRAKKTATAHRQPKNNRRIKPSLRFSLATTT